MLSLDDSRWQEFIGGYRVLYDASPALRAIRSGSASAEEWNELFEELHHQGDLGSASYAAVPHLVHHIERGSSISWQPFCLIATIELARTSRLSNNPPIPPDLANDYHAAIRRLPTIVAARPEQSWSAEIMPCLMSCLALAWGQRELAWVYREFDLDIAQDWYQSHCADPDAKLTEL